MSKNIKRFVCILMAMVLFMGIAANYDTAEAKTYTKAYVKKQLKQVNQKIKKTNKEIKKIEKQKAKAQKQLDKLTKGATGLAWTTVISENPLVIKGNILSGNSYYMVTKGASNITLFLGSATGFVKKTGKYKTYNDGWNTYTCAEVTGINTSKPEKKITSCNKKLKKKEATLAKLESKKYTLDDALKGKVEMDNNLTWQVGKTYNLNKRSDIPKYNKVKWKSSNSSILSVKGSTVKVKKKGKVKLTAKTTLSKKKKTFTIITKDDLKPFIKSYVPRTERISSLTLSQYDYLYEPVYVGDVITIGCKYQSGSQGKFTYKSSDSSVAKVDANGVVTVLADKNFTITISDGYDKIVFYFTGVEFVEDSTSEDTENSEDSYSDDDEYYYD